MNDMGLALGDFDEDGDPDFYVTNIFREGRHNVLLIRDPFVYDEASMAAGVDNGGWGWGTTFFDVDNDGDLDLGETNGWRLQPWDQPPRLYVHQGDSPPTFVDQAAAAGLTSDAWGSTLVAFDYDRDGDLDLLETVDEKALQLYQNQLDPAGDAPGDHHYLVIRPRMSGRNHWAIGAKVSVEIGGRTLIRWITAGTSYLGQEPAEAFFGLGTASQADRVTVTWPGGGETVLGGVPAGQVKTVLDDGIFSDGFEAGGLAAWSSTSGL